tara:strand:- start:7041 stop:7220 length:180 start_codon:yes stop_codon:yes gene_type:complete
MILELIAFIIVLAASALLLLIFFTIGDYIKSKQNNEEVITRTPLNSTIDELYKQTRKRK